MNQRGGTFIQFLARLPYVVRRAAVTRLGILRTGPLPLRGLLLWPSVDSLAEALHANPSTLLLGPAAETAEDALSRIGAQHVPGRAAHNPSLTVGPVARLLDLLATLERNSEEAARRFLQGLSFHINLDPERPLGVRRQAQLEHRLGLRIIDVLTDGESFGLLRCECGAFHPPDRAGFNIVEAHGRAAARTGSLTLDGAGRTPFVVSLESVACPFIGPTRSLVCHGREEQVVLSGPVPVGPADVENELCGFGVYVEAQCRCMTGGLDVTVTPYASEDFDASAATRALKRRFGLTGIRVICADAP